MKKKDKQTWVFIAITLGLILTAGFIAVNIVSSRLLGAKTLLSTHVLMSRRPDGEESVNFCYEGGNNIQFDYNMNFLRPNYFTFIVIDKNPLDTTNIVKCVQYPVKTYSFSERLNSIPRKAPGWKRIMFIGDSFTQGNGVPYGGAFPERINEILNICGNSKKFEVINLGKIGCDFPAIYTEFFKGAIISRIISDPDIIIYVWILNDVPTPAGYYSDFELHNNFMVMTNYYRGSRGLPFFRLIYGALIERRISASTIEWYKMRYSNKNADRFNESMQYIRKMYEESKQNGVDFRVVLFPLLIGDSKTYVFRSENEKVEKYLKENGIGYFDLTDYVLSYNTQDLWVHPYDKHPGPDTHYRAALAIADYLKIAPEECLNSEFTGLLKKKQRIDRFECNTDSCRNFKNKEMLSAFSRIIMEKAPEIPGKAQFYTLSPAFFDILKLGTKSAVTLVKKDEIENLTCGNNNNCVFVFSQTGAFEEYLALNLYCPDRYVFNDSNLFFCPLKEMRKIPANLLQ